MLLGWLFMVLSCFSVAAPPYKFITPEPKKSKLPTTTKAPPTPKTHIVAVNKDGHSAELGREKSSCSQTNFVWPLLAFCALTANWLIH